LPLLTFDRKRSPLLRRRLPGRFWVSPHTTQCTLVIDLCIANVTMRLDRSQQLLDLPHPSARLHSSHPSLQPLLLLFPTHLLLLNQSQKDTTVGQPLATKSVLTTFAAPMLATVLVDLPHLLTQSPDMNRETRPTTAGSLRNAKRHSADVTVTSSPLAETLPQMHVHLSAKCRTTSGSSIASKNVPLL
jgi:hypothetical protein